MSNNNAISPVGINISGHNESVGKTSTSTSTSTTRPQQYVNAAAVNVNGNGNGNGNSNGIGTVTGAVPEAAATPTTSVSVAQPLPTPMPKCVCNWRHCRTYQKAFREFKHPFYNGVIKLKFRENDPRSMALKSSIDRTLNVDSTRRNDWKAEAGTMMLQLPPSPGAGTVSSIATTTTTITDNVNGNGNGNGNADRYCRYYVARHHYTETLMKQFLSDRRSWDWYEPLPKDQAEKFLQSLEPQDIFEKCNGFSRYVQTPNVPKDHVRDLLK